MPNVTTTRMNSYHAGDVARATSHFLYKKIKEIENVPEVFVFFKFLPPNRQLFPPQKKTHSEMFYENMDMRKVKISNVI